MGAHFQLFQSSYTGFVCHSFKHFAIAVLQWISNFGIEAMFWDQIPIFDNLSSISQL